MTPEPPEGFQLRDATLEDASPIADLMNEVNLAEVGKPFTSVGEVRGDLALPEGDAWRENLVLVDDGGSTAGLLQVWSIAPPFTEIEQWAFVRPELWGRGLNAWLLRRGEELAAAHLPRAPDGARVRLFVPRWASNASAGRLFAALGYTYARTFWTMRIELHERVAVPTVLAGIRIRPFERGRDERRTHAALSEAFEDHWGSGWPSFEAWRQAELDGEAARYEPGLWFLATEDDEIVGVVCCRASMPSAPETGQVTALGVRRGWRGRSVGQALLLTGFEELRRRGVPRVELGVDAESPTGATRLYERAGMRVVQRSEQWVKELRPAG